MIKHHSNREQTLGLKGYFIQQDSYTLGNPEPRLKLIAIPQTQAMFTLYRIGFCSVSKVAPVQCEQELMFCCGAENVPKCSQCE